MGDKGDYSPESRGPGRRPRHGCARRAFVATQVVAAGTQPAYQL